MRQLFLWLNELEQHGTGRCGRYVVLEVSVGHKWTELLHVPSLTRIRMDAREVEEQLRSGRACEVPLRRGLIGTIEGKRRQFDAHAQERGVREARLPRELIQEALAGLRAQRRDEP